MISLRKACLAWSTLLLLSTLAPGCADDLASAGRACQSPADCYAGVDPASLSGEIECLDRVEGGYCTHFCDSDADCCAADGECPDGLRQVCAPFENSTQKRCFLSCEKDDLDGQDSTLYCQDYAHRDFGCRSTGGGSENRKVCTP
ncbi:MAG: hypothetical protein KC731_10100 [Myxococcales bacterium]|nr:hypothetical protein [Myxococcales bacterium]